MMTLIIDANVLVGELLRLRGQELIESSLLTLYTTEKVLDETQYELQRRIAIRISRNGLSPDTGQGILETAKDLISTKVSLLGRSSYLHRETEARRRIPRDPDDWETVALALEMDAAIWTQDCDFLGCGCPTWTTETLILQLNSDNGV